MGEKKSRKVPIILGIVLVCLLFYFCFGFFVIQPVGAIPKGITILYFRLGTSIDFIESPDGLAEKAGGVSLLSRAMAMGTFMKARGNYIIIRLPYMHFLYLISTGGKEYGQ